MERDGMCCATQIPLEEVDEYNGVTHLFPTSHIEEVSRSSSAGHRVNNCSVTVLGVGSSGQDGVGIFKGRKNVGVGVSSKWRDNEYPRYSLL